MLTPDQNNNGNADHSQNSNSKSSHTNNNASTADVSQAHVSKALVEAADWLVTITSDDPSAKQQADFQQWLQREENIQAYKALEQTWNTFELEQPQAAHKTINDALANKPSANKFTTKARLYSVAALAGLSLFLASQSQSGRFISADYYTLTEHTQSFTLPDNSKIKLLPRSAINIHYSQGKRNIELIKGQVFINVAKDTNRPLTIISEHGRAQALGTAFSVSMQPQVTTVKVSESTVKVCGQLVSAPCKIVNAGQQTTLTAKQVQPIQSLNNKVQIDWQQQTLTVDNQALTDVLNILQQHYPGYLKYDEKALQGLTISGVFSLQNTQESLRLMGTILPVKVKKYADLVLVLTKEN